MKHLAMCTSWPRICRICAFCCHEVQVSHDMSTSWSEPTLYPAVKTYVSETPYSHIWSPSVIPSTHQATNIKAPAPAPKPRVECSKSLYAASSHVFNWAMISTTKSMKHFAMCTSWPRICRICAFCCHEVQVSHDMSTSWSEPTLYPAVKNICIRETPQATN